MTGRSGPAPDFKRRLHQWALGIGPEDLIATGGILVLVGGILLTGLLGTSPIVIVLGNLALSGGILAVMFGIPWCVVDRIFS